MSEATKKGGTKSDADSVNILINPANDKGNEGYIIFTRKKTEELRTAYNQMRADKNYKFEFDGHELLVGYAKYLLEYLDGRLGTKK